MSFFIHSFPNTGGAEVSRRTLSARLPWDGSGREVGSEFFV